MIQKDLHQLSKTTRDLRKFGLVVGGAFLLLGGWLLFRHRPAWPWFLTPGALLAVLGLIVPRALKGVYVAWMGLAFMMGLVMSAVILTLFYFLVITPIALAGRLFGKDFLSEKLDAQAKSYWLPRDRSVARQPADFEQQY
jgi:uncharacterized BrkB/YihY/UPF0761 family membrane protein